jgi:hypothetical protein
MNLTDMVLAVSERQEATEHQLEELREAIKTLETQIAELKRSVVPGPVAVEKVAAKVTPDDRKTAVQAKEEVTPEVLLVIAAAATAFMGKPVQVRSAKMLQSPYEVVNPWSQQGRVFVQASHNLFSRK